MNNNYQFDNKENENSTQGSTFIKEDKEIKTEYDINCNYDDYLSFDYVPTELKRAKESDFIWFSYNNY